MNWGLVVDIQPITLLQLIIFYCSRRGTEFMIYIYVSYFLKKKSLFWVSLVIYLNCIWEKIHVISGLDWCSNNTDNAKMSTQKVKRRVGKYELGRTIGVGTFARVRVARNCETGEHVAIKILDKEKVLKHKLVEQDFFQTLYYFEFLACSSCLWWLSSLSICS